MNKKEIRIVFWGTPDFVVPVLQNLQQNFQVVGVVTSLDQKVGRKQLLTPSPVKSASEKLAVFTPQHLDQEVVEKLKELHPDLFVVAAFGQIIPENILQIPKYGSLNIHPSLLPKYRGPSPIQSAILNGDKVSGITIIQMDSKMDHGPIIYTKEIILSEEDNFQTLSKKMFSEAAADLVKIIPDFIAGKIKLRLQDDAIASYCNLIKKEDGYFDLQNPPSQERLERMVRAYYPWPTAWTKWMEKIVKFLPGKMVQIEGKKPTPLADFLHGYPNFPLKS